MVDTQSGCASLSVCCKKCTYPGFMHKLWFIALPDGCAIACALARNCIPYYLFMLLPVYRLSMYMYHKHVMYQSYMQVC